MNSPAENARRYRSKLRRPCDRCRRRKTTCALPADGPCESCVSTNQPCTFEMPPTKRRRGPATAVDDDRCKEVPDNTAPVEAEIHEPRPSSNGHGGDTCVVANTQANTITHTITPQPIAQLENVPPASPKTLLTPPIAQPGSPFLHTIFTPAVQRVCTLDNVHGSVVQMCGISAELDPWLLRHGRYDEYGLCELHGNRIRNVGGVPVQGLVPVHFMVNEDRIPAFGTEERHQYIEQMIPYDHGMRLLSLFLTFVFPSIPIVSRTQLEIQLPERRVPAVLLAAMYASALPFTAHDPVLFACSGYDRIFCDRLWDIVLDGIRDEMRSPKLAVLQASLLYLQRLPSHEERYLSDTPLRSSFHGSTVTLAMSLGLHLEPRPWGIPDWEKRLRRRVWWAVYSEDKWTSLLLGRPPLIQQDEWDVMHLDDLDFELDAPSIYQRLSMRFSPDDILFARFVELSRLVELTHKTFFTLRASQRLAEDFRAALEAARPIREGLQAWYSALPEELRVKERLSHNHFRHHRPGVATLHISYLTLELFLYRAILRPLARSPPPPPIIQENDLSTFRAIGSEPDPSVSSWLFDDLTMDNFQLDRLPGTDFAEYGEAAEVTLNAAEKCAGIIVKFVANLMARDFDGLWSPWTRTCFAAVTNFIVLLLVQAPTIRHAERSKDLLERWSLHLRCQHKTHEDLLGLGLLRLHNFHLGELDRIFLLSPAATEVLYRSRTTQNTR